MLVNRDDKKSTENGCFLWFLGMFKGGNDSIVVPALPLALASGEFLLHPSIQLFTCFAEPVEAKH